MKYLILGAGPAGLAFACQLKRRGEDSFIILEKEKEAGGLCRSMVVDGSPLDIGGGHFLDVRRPRVTELLFSYMPKDEWRLFRRDSRIDLGNIIISHPFEANIWQMGVMEQVEYLESISRAGCNRGVPIPDKFIDWIRWKLGDKIAETYMIPYNKKMFADNLNDLGTYWLEKLPNVSFKETLLSCLSHKAYGTQPGHEKFYYPKHYGYGEVWLRMADSLKQHIYYETQVVGIDCKKKEVTTKNKGKYRATNIITTIPWQSYEYIDGLPVEVVSLVRKLQSSAIETRYCAQDLNTRAHWIYYPDEKLPYHRILVRHNFCTGSRGYWMETRGERAKLFKQTENNTFAYMNAFAYPINTLDKPQAITTILEYAKAEQIYGLGRWGEHCHYNSDLTVELAMNLADDFKNM